MQIQRIQTVYIFLALVAMAIFMVVPYGTVYDTTVDPQLSEKLYTFYEYGLIIPVAVSAILLVIDIFLYRNMSLQSTVLTIALLLTMCSIGVVCFALFKQARAEGLDAEYSVWDILLPIAVLFEIFAISAIKHDIKLLNSYNRLR